MFDAPPKVTAEVFARLPDRYRNRGGQDTFAKTHFKGFTGAFLEGPCFTREGDFYCVDVPGGRIFRIDQNGEFDLAVQYDGEPAGLAAHPDGRIFVTDVKNGIMVFDPKTGKVEPFVTRRSTERFKGPNDLIFASNGDIYFTDQGLTGLQDPTGRLYRIRKSGALECVLEGIPSPNGLVMNLSEDLLYLAVTRANAVWRVPILEDGSTLKVGVFVQTSGGMGPDGLALDADGGLVIAHAAFGSVWLTDAKGEPKLRIVSPEGLMTTNVAFGIKDPHHLYITESASGSILRVKMPQKGHTTYAQMNP
ncbi:SMP-30/gluconolactonase/LRE family protein [Pseudorhodoferax sp.]|uniref:SMP-30/gluconolactonase/LRE family protein n=1 Tax=Pseudorhodoferax sp. TaxID=1993553 RepID=UPI0039E66FC3